MNEFKLKPTTGNRLSKIRNAVVSAKAHVNRKPVSLPKLKCLEKASDDEK